ncbi:MAG: MerR family transcriptional regulator [Alphaproteobacteria bacterium]|nr:MerR family transcriptional regulator [Alphaproteobacteria bacterium]
MEYSIGQVAQRFGLTTHTLRYYDKEGLLSIRKNSSGLRRFSEEDINRLIIIDCLKATGLRLKEIKHYFDLCRLGEQTLEERRQLFYEQEKRLKQQLVELQQNLARIEFKIKYYNEALRGGEKGIYERNASLAAEKKKLFKIYPKN